MESITSTITFQFKSVEIYGTILSYITYTVSIDVTERITILSEAGYKLACISGNNEVWYKYA